MFCSSNEANKRLLSAVNCVATVTTQLKSGKWQENTICSVKMLGISREGNGVKLGVWLIVGDKTNFPSGLINLSRENMYLIYDVLPTAVPGGYPWPFMV